MIGTMKQLVFVTIFLFPLMLVGQAKPGLYLTMDMDMEICDHKMKMLKTDQVFCLSEEPLLEYDSFERVGQLVYDSAFSMHRFSIVLTKKGADFVSTIATKLPGHQLALVVNGILVSLIDLDGISYAGSIMIWDVNNSESIVWIHRSLVKGVTKNSRKS